MNIIVFVVRIWGLKYREELILNVTLFVVRVWELQNREELVQNFTVLVARDRGINMQRN